LSGENQFCPRPVPVQKFWPAGSIFRERMNFGEKWILDRSRGRRESSMKTQIAAKANGFFRNPKKRPVY
jgi:hypothetical protein